jgi:hypothetical protein
MMRPLLLLLPIAVTLCGACGCASQTPKVSAPPQTPPTVEPPAKPIADPLALPSTPPPAQPSSVTPSRSAQTSDERWAALDKRLDDSFGAFDAQLKKEQQKIAQERDARPAADTFAAFAADKSDSGAAAAEVPNDSGESGTARQRRGADRGSARPGDLKSDKVSAGTEVSAGNGAAATEVPDGSDDDIVARRLRKAAEQETDPELKDKLWKEYLEYRKNTQRR